MAVMTERELALVTNTQSPPPPPPPLPEPSPDPRRSFLAKLASIPHEDRNQPLPGTFTPRPPWQPRHYFFYGSLKEPEVLGSVLDLSSPPSYHPAIIERYELAKWGQYPTLLDGPTGNEVSGLAYLVQTQDHQAKLAYYETRAYIDRVCTITFTDGKQPFILGFCIAFTVLKLGIGRLRTFFCLILSFDPLPLQSPRPRNLESYRH
jgi:hypothetical protein